VAAERLGQGGVTLTPSLPPGQDQEVEVEIRGINSAGAGVGSLPDGRTVFVQRTAPGDRARVRLVEERSRWARARLAVVTTPGEGRREPPCPRYAECGGCTLQHLRYRAQLVEKARGIAAALRRIGGFVVDPPEVVPSPLEFRYRNRVTFTLLRLPRGRVVAGFHALEEPGRIVEVGGECLLPEEPIAEAWIRLRDGWGPRARHLPGGDRLRLTLRSVEGGVVLVIHGGDGIGEPERLVEVVPALVAVWHRPEGGDPVLVAGRRDAAESWGGLRVPVGSSAFLQVNREAGRLLHDAVLREVGRPAGLSIVDAYCGAGVLGRRLARHGARVVGVELDPSAVEAARSGEGVGEGGHGDFRLLHGRVEERLEECLPADLVILNPPRTGVDERIPRLLRGSPPARMVYVSCDPSTLARDLRRLGEAFRLERVQAFDLFPQTAHVETVVTLARHTGER